MSLQCICICTVNLSNAGLNYYFVLLEPRQISFKRQNELKVFTLEMLKGNLNVNAVFVHWH